MHSRSSSSSSSRSVNPGGIHKLDFDANRRPPSTNHDSSSSSPRGLLQDDESFFSNVVDGVIERDRRKMRRHVLKYISFASAILSCLCAGSITAYSLYGPLFLKRLRYTQAQVNAVSITAELAMYLPVPIFGYLCDRYNPRPLSLASGVFFGVGYLVAALTYHAGPRGSEGAWPFWVMLVAFLGVGWGTSCMYMSAMTTCAKNFGRGKYKGIALAMPIASFGLSGMWQSQVGSHFFAEKKGGDIDVFRYFLFLAGLLFGVGLVGSVALRVFDEELIDEAVDELERSGLLEESPFFRRSILHDGENTTDYGTLSPTARSTSSLHGSRSYNPDDVDTIAAKKMLLLNVETRIFLTDPTMWLLASGFFLTTGPGEAFVNNLGTIIDTFYPPASHDAPASNSPATHVSLLAITSTLARLLTGTISDLLAPTTTSNIDRPNTAQNRTRTCTVSRLIFLLGSTLLFSFGQLLLASGAVQRTPTLFPAVTACVGFGYGAIFSLTPIIVSVVWGVQNFGTNWGIVAVVPAAGAAIWGAIYSAVYQAGVDSSPVRFRDGGREKAEEKPGGGLCFGGKCYQSTFWGMAVCSWVAVALWVCAWRSWRRKGVAV